MEGLFNIKNSVCVIYYLSIKGDKPHDNFNRYRRNVG